jgi:hypothetical protein
VAISFKGAADSPVCLPGGGPGPGSVVGGIPAAEPRGPCKVLRAYPERPSRGAGLRPGPGGWLSAG